ncbi:BatA domain-containing protein [Pontibacter mangrovi]|uniref:Aerotolerance regulator N-terminal domain-containing protein n=1 Tax=Pontibacter mangrovi TaxID=2589816 RepID=A0A501WBK7_9BACT|nr:BatA domain-containing protein [Pontibacter mangrovi]TPE45444.1 hypothetical protein FJM65_05290 [Pontibacter mangrovi]
MTLTAPYFLFAASAILIPIAIHLWNKRQGKTVKVGSLRWLEASASSRWSSIKLNNFWLLVLRCLILILLAVALAQPVWEHQAQEQRGAKAIVVGEELLYKSALKLIQPTIDSLLQRGYTLRKYTPGLAQVPQEAWQQISRRTTDSTLRTTQNYWALLPLLAGKYKNPQDSVWLFTSDQARYFAGARPKTIPENIRWIPVATEGTAYWLQAAVHTSPDSLMLILGQSTRQAIIYSKHPIPASAQSIALPHNQRLRLQRHNDSLQASYKGYVSKVSVQAAPLQVSILAEEAQQEQAKHVQAAVQAISRYTGFPIVLSPDTPKTDFLFWLHRQELPPSILQRVRQGLQVWVPQGAIPSGLNASTSTVPEVQAQQVGKGNIYTLRDSVSLAWMKERGRLPELLLPLLLPQPKVAAAYDVRALDEQQLMPEKQSAVVAAAVPQARQEPLLRWLVLAAAILFLIERFIAGRRSNV